LEKELVLGCVVLFLVFIELFESTQKLLFVQVFVGFYNFVVENVQISLFARKFLFTLQILLPFII